MHPQITKQLDLFPELLEELRAETRVASSEVTVVTLTDEEKQVLRDLNKTDDQ